MRAWLIGGNLVLAGVLVTMLILMPLTERNQPAAIAAPPAEVVPTETPQEQTATFARSLGVQTLLAIKAGAREPGSVRFRDVFTVNLGDDSERLILVCGQVMGRNGFGGYTGFDRFVATSERDVKIAGMIGFESFYADCIRGKTVVPISL